MRVSTRHPSTLVALLAAAVLALLAGLVAATSTAEAHADLASSTPAEGSSFPRSPQRVEITFTEQVAVEQSGIHVLDVSGARVDLDDLRGVEGDPFTLRVGLPADLPEGIYTVAWNNLSSVDGHTLSGSYVFFIGSGTFPSTGGQGTVVPGDDGGDALPVAEPLTRWSVLLGLVLLAGTPWVFGLVLAGATPAEEARTLREQVEQLAVLGGGVVLFAGAMQLVLKLNETGGDLSLLTDTRWGAGWLLRTVLATIATVGYALPVFVRGARLPRQVRPLLPAIALAAALSVSLTSHGAAAEDYALMAGLVDAMHVLATIAWGGGLVAFLVLAWHVRSGRGQSERAQSEVLRAAVPRFTVLGGLATFTLAVTGIYAAWLHVGAFDGIATAYGRGVALKVLLLALLVTVAAMNTTWVRRRVGNPREVLAGARWLRRLLAAEVALIVLVLASSGVLTSIEPARQQLASEERAEGMVTESEDAGLEIRSAIAPGNVGPNRVSVTLSRNGDRYEDATAVELRYVNMEAALSATTVPLAKQEDGTWALAEPAILTVDGIYQFSFRVQWPEGLDATQATQFETGAVRATRVVDVRTAWWAGGAVLIAIGAAMIVANTLASRRHLIRSELLGWSGGAIVAAALILATRAPEVIGPATNPMPATAESIAAGGEIYAANCVRCHGTDYSGNGPDADTLPARPVDLVLHFPQHSDGQHYAVIENGRPQSGMPAWKDDLTEEQIWDVINFLRSETEALMPTLNAP